MGCSFFSLLPLFPLQASPCPSGPPHLPPPLCRLPSLGVLLLADSRAQDLLCGPSVPYEGTCSSHELPLVFSARQGSHLLGPLGSTTSDQIVPKDLLSAAPESSVFHLIGHRFSSLNLEFIGSSPYPTPKHDETGFFIFSPTPLPSHLTTIFTPTLAASVKFLLLKRPHHRLNHLNDFCLNASSPHPHPGPPNKSQFVVLQG